MLSREFTYEDFKGNVRTETCWFGYLQSELTHSMFSKEEDLIEHLKRIINAGDTAEIMATFKNLILSSYGVMSPDGRCFDKSEALATAFSHTKMYDILYMELCTDADKAIEFLKGVMPKETKKFDKTNFERITEEVSPKVEQAAQPIPFQPAPVASQPVVQPVQNPTPTQPVSFPPIQ